MHPPPNRFATMQVALTVNDFLRRAELVYPDRTAIVDEPGPAPTEHEVGNGRRLRR